MSVALVWLRRDLRIMDNPALVAAARHSVCIPVYIYNPADEGDWAPGAASRWWLHHSLAALSDALAGRGSRLIIRRSADTLTTLRQLVADTGAQAVYWNRLYDPALVERDRTVKSALRNDGVQVESFVAALLREPWEVKRRDGGNFRAFTPFWNALKALPAESPEGMPQALGAPDTWPGGDDLESLGLRPRIPWDAAFPEYWEPGERGAQQALKAFIAGRLPDYAETRDIPGVDGTSRLSPHLHWGEISPRRIYDSIKAHAATTAELPDAAVDSFLAEIGWREFAHHLLYHFKDMPAEPLDRRFRDFPWATDWQASLHAWEQGRTGIPIVDAGMRELWRTGWMHNRVRMIVGSLLTKNLRVPWQCGEAWFWDTLVDADLASNSMGWQWIQGCGADAAPYFRIFNPVRQGERFDPDGRYVRHWVPEIAQLPDRYLHAPWTAPEAERSRAGVRLGHTYPEPIVDPGESRKSALAAYQTIRG